MIIGKLLGALIGYLMSGDLIGTLLGAGLGHLVDRRLSARLRARLRAGLGGGPGAGMGAGMGGGAAGWGAPGRTGAVDNRAASQAFFDATFSVMGHVAKADGRVDESEIALAEALMTRMQLGPERRREAIARFGEGKSEGFAPDAVIGRLVQAAPGQTALFVSFLQIQMQVAMADGEFDPSEEAVLLDTARLLGVPALVFRQIQMIARMSRHQAGGAGAAGPGGAGGRAGAGAQAGAGRPVGRSAPTLEQAFAVLGVPPDADRATTKAAWRREISENHPDKLASQGLPKEMMDAATDRTQAIQKGWDTIREAKGWR